MSARSHPTGVHLSTGPDPGASPGPFILSGLPSMSQDEPRTSPGSWAGSPRADRIFRIVLGVVVLASAAVMVSERDSWHAGQPAGAGSRLAFDALVGILVLFGLYTVAVNAAAAFRGDWE